MKRYSSIAALMLWISFCLPGQTPTGTVQGTVTDPTGALVSGANVTVTNNGTNEKKELKTDSAGRYVLPFLTPGAYTVAVGATGFNSAKVDNVKIDVSQTRSIDFKLKVGSISQEVQVEAAATPLDTATATTGRTKRRRVSPIGVRRPTDIPLQ